MEKYYRKTFMSWYETGKVWNEDLRIYVNDTVRAIALCEGNWFHTAINALRDGDMGKKDDNGVYSRKWFGDDIYNQDVEDVRPASLTEVELYLKYCPLEEDADIDGREVVAIIYNPDQTDVIFRRRKP